MYWVQDLSRIRQGHDINRVLDTTIDDDLPLIHQEDILIALSKTEGHSSNTSTASA